MGLVWATYRIGSLYFSQPQRLKAQTPSSPVQQIRYKTDGHLPDRWLQSFMALPAKIAMMEVDIFELKRKLELHPQIIRAEIERIFPSEIRVQLYEQQPVFRAVLMDRMGRKQLKLVSEQGTLFDGLGYNANQLKKVPFVRPYQNRQGGYFPLKGTARVCELLTLLQKEVPLLARQLRVVSLEHFSGDAAVPGEVIRLQTPFISSIVFGAHQGLKEQIDRLNFILKHIKARGNPAIATIDLSLKSAAAVQLKSAQLSAYD